MFAIGIDRISVTIASGQSVSPLVNLGAKTLVAIGMPAAWDAAVLTFQSTVDDTNFLNVWTAAGTELSVPAAAGLYIPIDRTLWYSLNSIKLRSGTSVTPVAQTANRTLILVTRSDIT